MHLRRNSKCGFVFGLAVRWQRSALCSPSHESSLHFFFSTLPSSLPHQRANTRTHPCRARQPNEQLHLSWHTPWTGPHSRTTTPETCGILTQSTFRTTRHKPISRHHRPITLTRTRMQTRGQTRATSLCNSTKSHTHRFLPEEVPASLLLARTFEV